MESIAIVGSGIAGLGCAHFLQNHFDLTIFEASDHIGGHSNTLDVTENDEKLPVDSGFMVYNEVTYPLLTRLFSELQVPTKETTMSFSVQHKPSGVEWNGTTLNGLFAQRRNLFSPRFWKFLLQLNRFNKESVTALQEPQWAEMTLATYVRERGYGQDFLDRYLIPMSSAVWSTPPEKMLQFPAKTLLHFWYNHGFLGLDARHQWRTVHGGSREYVRRLIRPFQDRIHTQTPVESIRRGSSGIHLTTQGKAPREYQFDRVILAAHANQSLKILADPTTMESDLLSFFLF